MYNNQIKIDMAYEVQNIFIPTISSPKTASRPTVQQLDSLSFHPTIQAHHHRVKMQKINENELSSHRREERIEEKCDSAKARKENKFLMIKELK